MLMVTRYKFLDSNINAQHLQPTSSPAVWMDERMM